MNRVFLKQLVQFVGIGFINTSVDIVIFNILLWIFGVPATVVYIIFRIVSFGISNTNSYLLNTYFTFNTQRSLKSFAAFFTATITGFLVSTVIATIVFELLQETGNGFIAANLGMILGTIASMIVNFILYKYVVFKK
ncbi:MAG TPA: GtrA family protein [Candidatus Paceibacterota bacterium]|nr:GtrA family protein [Candidatus Paceibacterota bacterium]